MKRRALVVAAAFCLVLTASVRAVAQTPTDPRIQETQERIARGERLYEAGDFSGALVEFQRAQDLLEGHPMQHLATYNIGRCQERLFRYDQAMIHYRRYLERAGPDAEDRGEVAARIEILEGLLATVHLQVNIDDYEVWVDERSFGQGVSDLLIPGGSHVVEVRAAGHEPARRELDIPARSEQTLTFDLEALAEGFSGVHRAFFWASAGLAVATVAVGAALGGVALGRSSRLEEQLADPVEGWLVTSDDLSRISNLALTADILYGTAGLFAVAAIVLAFFTDWGRGDDGHAESGRPLLAPAAGRGSMSLTLGGRF